MSDFLNESDSGSRGITPRPYHETWIRYILEFPLDSVKDEKETKNTLIKMLMPVINTAARSNLKRNDVRLFLWGYDNVWKSFFVYKRKGNYDPDLLVLKRCLREGFALMLYRSIEMRQMGMILEPKQSVFQRFVSGTERKVGFFKNKKKDIDNSMEGSE